MERNKKMAEEMVFTDSLMFRYVMRDKERCRQVLEKVVGIKGIDYIKFLDTERDVMAEIDAKRVRMDVFLKDDKNRSYTIEMQSYVEKGLGRRIQYYQSIADIEMMDSGDEYEKFHEHMIIFFCTYQPFKGRSDCRYEFCTCCTKDPKLQLEDGVRKIIITSAGDFSGEEEDVQAFLQYMNGIKVENALVEDLDQGVREGRHSRVIRRSCMDYWRDVEARAQKVAQERAEKMAQEMALEKAEELAQEKVQEEIRNVVYRMLDDGLPPETAARFADVPVEIIQKWSEDRKKAL